MAEVTAMRNNALAYPVYGVPYVVVFPMLDADGDLVTGATTPDAEVSKNGDTFADCTNESTEIATASGVYYLSLTAAEMTADIVTVIAKSATAGMKTTTLTLYPKKLVSLHSGTVGANAADGTTIQLASGASTIDDFYNGCLVVGTIDTVVEARLIGDYVGSTLVCTISGPAFATAAPDNNDTYVVYAIPESRVVNQSTVVGWVGTTLPSPDTAGYPKVTIKDGTGTGEIDTNAGAIVSVTTAANVTSVNGLAANVITAAATAADFSTEVNAAVLAVLGALNDAAADGAVTTTDTMVAYLKQLINTLEGAPGLPTWPASAAPANGVSIAEALRYLYDQVGVAGAGLTAADDAVIAAIPSAATVADAVWDEDATAHQTGGTFGQAIGDPGADTNTIFKATVTDATGATVGVDAAAILADTGTDGVIVASLATGAVTAAALASDAVDEIWAKAMSDLAAVPAANASVLAAINWIFELARNKITQTATTGTIFKDDASTSLATTTVSDDATTYTRGEWA